MKIFLKKVKFLIIALIAMILLYMLALSFSKDFFGYKIISSVDKPLQRSFFPDISSKLDIKIEYKNNLNNYLTFCEFENVYDVVIFRTCIDNAIQNLEENIKVVNVDEIQTDNFQFYVNFYNPEMSTINLDFRLFLPKFKSISINILKGSKFEIIEKTKSYYIFEAELCSFSIGNGINDQSIIYSNIEGRKQKIELLVRIVKNKLIFYFMKRKSESISGSIFTVKDIVKF